jgi:hypothetical protein
MPITNVPQERTIKMTPSSIKATYREEEIRSIGELVSCDGRTLTPVFRGFTHPLFVSVSEDEFQSTAGDAGKMKSLAVSKLNSQR